jgi:hypothetical protein
MRVLLVGTMPEAVQRVERELVAAGHEIVSCHAEGTAPFPCNALRDGAQCPLQGAPVDVAVTVRDRPWAWPSPYEDGATCAVRHLIPLLTVDASVNPFEPWTTLAVSSRDDLAAACEEAANAPLSEHSRVADAMVREVLTHAALDDASASAIVRRRRGALKVSISLPDAAADLRGMVAARVGAALRDLDHSATGIDVGFETPR